MTKIVPTISELRMMKLMAEPGMVWSTSGGLNPFYSLEQWKDGKRISHEKCASFSSSRSGDFYRSGIYERLTSEEEAQLGFKNTILGADYKLTDYGRQILAENLHRLEEDDRKKAEKRAQIERLAVIGFSSYGRHDSQGRKYAGLVRLIKKTPKGYKVEPVMLAYALFNNNRYLDDSWYHTTVTGAFNSKNMSVLDSDILVDGITEEGFRRLVEIDGEAVADREQRKKQMEDELAPILARYKDREIQAAAMYDDMVAEVLKQR